MTYNLSLVIRKHIFCGQIKKLPIPAVVDRDVFNLEPNYVGYSVDAR